MLRFMYHNLLDCVQKRWIGRKISSNRAGYIQNCVSPIFPRFHSFRSPQKLEIENRLNFSLVYKGTNMLKWYK